MSKLHEKKWAMYQQLGCCCMSILIFILAACKKDEGPPRVVPSRDDASFFIFRSGSRYIYTDSLGSQSDTFTINNTQFHELPYDDMRAHVRQQFVVMNCYHTGVGEFDLVLSKFSQAYPYELRQRYNRLLLIRTIGVVPDGVPDWILSNMKIEKITPFTSLTINQMQLDSCFTCTLDLADLPPIGANFTECTYAKNIGLVRYKLSDGRTFLLKEHNAVPVWPLP